MTIDATWIHDSQAQGMTFEAAWRDAWRNGDLSLSGGCDALREGERVPYIEALKVEAERAWNYSLGSAVRNARELVNARHAGMSETAAVRYTYSGGSDEFAREVALRCALTVQNGTVRA